MQDYPDWFNNSNNATPPEQPRKAFRLGPVLAIIVIIALLIGGGVLAYNLFTRQACLTINDYRQLTGQDYPDKLDATTNFYTTLIEFQNGNTDYNDANGNGKSRLQSIATFYQAHKNTSLRITIDSTYPDSTYLALTTKRALTVKKALVAAGIADERIIVNQPAFTPPEEPLDYDETLAAPGTVTVSITSLEGCR